MFARPTKFALLAMALLAAPLYAADTEIYLSADLTKEVKPNILFIVDTSGSMVDEKNKVPGSSKYDPTKTYTGIYDNSKIYYGDVGATVSTAEWFSPSINYCDAAVKNIAQYGYSYQKYAFFISNNWKSVKIPTKFTNTNRTTYKIECASDYGNHGAVTGTYYPVNTAAAWSTTVNGSTVNWNSGYGYRMLYSGNYLNFSAGKKGLVELTRLEVVQDALESLIADLDGVNAAVMRFEKTGEARGGYLVTPMLELTPANKTILTNAVNAFSGDSDTPTAGAMYEALLYFQGLAPKVGYGISPAGTVVDKKYVSPIVYQCQKNFIVLFSDGDPTRDNDADTAIAGIGDFKTLSTACSFKASDANGLVPTADCTPSLAEYLRKKDLSTKFSGTQSAITYTVGFASGMSDFGNTMMNDAAKRGGGFYRPVNTADEITAAFQEIINNILAVNTSFTAPAVSVNAFNRLSYLDEIYYAVFRPNTLPKWDGNVKRYRLAKSETESTLSLLDANGKIAIDPKTGFFSDTSRSYWSTEVDGGDVSLGGAASMMELPRTTYTCCFGSSVLSASSNKLDETTNYWNLTPDLFGAIDKDERDKIVKWARGVDVNDADSDGSTTDARTQLGDPLHSEPLLITYGKRGDNTPDMTLYVTTNEGLLHAIDTSDGRARFSYMPKALFKNLKPLVANNPADELHPYGLDGPISSWVYDKNHDGKIDPTDDHVYLYLTMRRGGRNIYALDVTNRDAPEQMWMIEGGTNTAQGDFTELSETWSKATPAKVSLGGVVKNVLFFGGGYDTIQDGANTRTIDKVGRAIYMVDADKAAKDGGKLLWSAGPGTWADLKLPSMSYSIPSEVRVVDVDGDNLADRLYVADMGGRLWRFDINVSNKGSSDFATGGIIADVTVDGSTEDNRRFYYPPSVSMSARGDYLNIAMGSGYREHPLNRSIRDRFYVFRDPNVDGPATDAGGHSVYSLLSNNLVDATNWLTPEAVNHAALAASSGYYIDLKTDGTWQGEKVLAPALTMGGYVIFTTYTPVATAMADACAPTEGLAKMYTMNVEDSTPLPGVTERSTELAHGGIPPRPVAITVQDGSAIIVGTNVQDGDLGLPPIIKSNWRRN